MAAPLPFGDIVHLRAHAIIAAALLDSCGLRPRPRMTPVALYLPN